MIIDTSKVEMNENNWLDKEGRFTFKIEKFEEDGFVASGDDAGAVKFKLYFKGKEAGNDKLYSHSEMFNVGQKSLWRIKELEIALKAPDVYDIEDFIGRYVIVNIVSRNYPKNDGTQGTAFNVKSWEYSKLNDAMPSIPKAKQDTNNDTAQSYETSIPTIDIDNDEIPF